MDFFLFYFVTLCILSSASHNVTECVKKNCNSESSFSDFCLISLLLPFFFFPRGSGSLKVKQ